MEVTSEFVGFPVLTAVSLKNSTIIFKGVTSCSPVEVVRWNILPPSSVSNYEFLPASLRLLGSGDGGKYISPKRR